MTGGLDGDLRRLGEMLGRGPDAFRDLAAHVAARAVVSEPQAECATCGREPMCDGTRFVPSDGERVAPCPAFADFDRTQRLRRAQERAGVSARHRSCTLEGFVPPNRLAEAAVRIVAEYVASWPAPRDRGEGLYLWGPTGTGKTHLAYAALNALVDAPHHVEAIVVGASRLLDDLRRGYGGHPEEGERLVTAAKSATMLLLDDLGVAKPSDWVHEQTYALVDRRYTDGLPTIITGNDRPDHLGARIGRRAASRIHEMCQIVPVPGEDVRVMMAEARDRR